MTIHSTHTDLRPGTPGMFPDLDCAIDEAIDEFEDDAPSGEIKPAENRDKTRSIALIDTRTLQRECLRNSLISQGVSWNIAAFGSIHEWRTAEPHPPFAAILLYAGAQQLMGPDAAGQLKKLVQGFDPTPVIILSDSDEIGQIASALECGVRGFIPSSVSIGVCIEAINLALAGGTFVPASSVLAKRQAVTSGTPQDNPLAELFTPKQIKVANAIRQGKPNKIIAYELNMCESTVKVHIRNIMQKLNATNRTQVAYKMWDLFPHESA